MAERKKDAVLSDEAIAARLRKELDHWRHEDGHLVRTYRTHGWKGTLMVVNAVGHLAEAAWHHPDLDVSYDKVGVKLVNHDAGGVTEKCFALAGKIESVVQWQPAAEGVLDGTPNDDKRFGYIKYD